MGIFSRPRLVISFLFLIFLTFTISPSLVTAVSKPQVTDNVVSKLQNVSVQLNGYVNPGGLSTSYRFRYGTSTAYGKSTGPSDIGAGTSWIDVNSGLFLLSPNTTYYYRLEASNSAGTTYGEARSFRTYSSPQNNAKPTITTGAVYKVTSASGALSGTINPNGDDTTWFFKYGKTNDYGITSEFKSIVGSREPISVSITISSLEDGTTYHYCLCGYNSEGLTNGADKTFTTTALQPDPDPEPAQPSKIYYPHFASELPWLSYIGTINQGTSSVTGVLSFYNSNGVLLAERDMTLRANARNEYNIADEFNIHTTGYAVFESPSPQIIGYTKFFLEGVYRASIPAVPEMDISGDELFIPAIYSDGQWITGLAFVNTTNEPQNINVEFNSGEKAPITLQPGAHYSSSVSAIFGTAKPQITSARITGASGIVGLAVLFKGSMLAGYLLNDKISTELYYPHIVDDDSWWTTLAAYNPNPIASNVKLHSYDAEGSLLFIQDLLIDPYECFLGDVGNGLTLPSGTAWVKLSASVPLNGMQLAGRTNHLQAGGYSVVNNAGEKGCFVRIDISEVTGVAFVNTEESSAEIVLTARNDQGTQMATTTIHLAPYAKTVAVIEALFPGNDISTATYVNYSSDTSVAGFQINLSNNGRLMDALSGNSFRFWPSANEIPAGHAGFTGNSIIAPGAEILLEGIFYDETAPSDINKLATIFVGEDLYFYHPALGTVPLNETTSNQSVGEYLYRLRALPSNDQEKASSTRHSVQKDYQSIIYTEFSNSTTTKTGTKVDYNIHSEGELKITNRKRAWLAYKASGGIVKFILPQKSGLSSKTAEMYKKSLSLPDMEYSNSATIAYDHKELEFFLASFTPVGHCALGQEWALKVAYNKDPGLFVQLNTLEIVDFIVQAVNHITNQTISDCWESLLTQQFISNINLLVSFAINPKDTDINMLAIDANMQDIMLNFGKCLADTIANKFLTGKLKKIVKCIVKLVDCISFLNWTYNEVSDAIDAAQTSAFYDKLIIECEPISLYGMTITGDLIKNQESEIDIECSIKTFGFTPPLSVYAVLDSIGGPARLNFTNGYQADLTTYIFNAKKVKVTPTQSGTFDIPFHAKDTDLFSDYKVLNVNVQESDVEIATVSTTSTPPLQAQTPGHINFRCTISGNPYNKFQIAVDCSTLQEGLVVFLTQKDLYTYEGNVLITPSSPGTFAVTYTLVDEQGNRSTKSDYVIVTEPISYPRTYKGPCKLTIYSTYKNGEEHVCSAESEAIITFESQSSLNAGVYVGGYLRFFFPFTTSALNDCRITINQYLGRGWGGTYNSQTRTFNTWCPGLNTGEGTHTGYYDEQTLTLNSDYTVTNVYTKQRYVVEMTGIWTPE